MSRRSVLMEALAATPRDLARLLRPVSAAAALVRSAPDQWCIADVVAHLGTNELRHQERLRLIVEQDNPRVPYIHPDEHAHDLTRSLLSLQEEFVGRRAETLAFLGGLSQGDWGRPLVHETRGPSRLREQVQGLVDHDSAHLEQIVALREWLASP
ncbi:MAG: DinB family protein [Roseiflexaceae bacterium]